MAVDVTVDPLTHSWKLTDTGKLVMVFFAARAGEGNETFIEAAETDTYVFLLKEEKVVAFTYPFRLLDRPYSDELREDLFILARADYISYHSPVSLTERGTRWARNQVGDNPGRVEVFGRLSDKLRYYYNLEPQGRFDLVYAMITGHRAVTR